MKKLLLLIVLVLVSCSGFAAELTADTPAVEPSNWDTLLKFLLTSFGMLLNWLTIKGLPLLNSYFKAHMHFRGSEAVADALTQAIGEMSAEVQKALADGVITETEKATIKTRAREIAKDKLQRMSGFYKPELLKWIDEQLEVGLGKLLLLGGLRKN